MKNKNIHLIIKSVDKDSLVIFKNFIQKQINRENIDYKSFNLPITKKRITLLKSPHVNKSAREQFEIKYYKCFFQFSFKLKLNFLKLLFLNKPKTITLQLKTVF